MRPGDATRFFDLRIPVPSRETDEPHDDADGVDAALLKYSFSPTTHLRADDVGLAQPPDRAAFDPAALLRRDVLRSGGKASWLPLRVEGNLLQLPVEDPHHVPVPTSPESTAPPAG